MTAHRLQSEPSEKVQNTVFDQLGLFVYLLIDPETGEPFYVGKGVGTRPLQHQWEAMLSPDTETTERLEEGTDPIPEADADGRESRRKEISRKTAKIREVNSRPKNSEPEIWIVRHNLTKGEYTAVEAAAIDLLASFPVSPFAKTDEMPKRTVLTDGNLTNLRREKSAAHGIVPLEVLIQEFSLEELPTDTPPLMTISLSNWVPTPEGEDVPWGKRYGHGYKQAWLSTEQRLEHLDEIAESAAAWFHFNPNTLRTRRIRYVVAVHRMVTRALLRIVPGSIQDMPQGPGANGQTRRGFEFEVVRPGHEDGPEEKALYDQVIGDHGKRINRSRVQNPVYYWPR